MKSFEYPIKILVLWGEAIGGNEEAIRWLIANGYNELGLFVYALRNIDKPREWLLKNGYPHLMALINGAEGKKDAVNWLLKNGFPLLSKVALAADGDVQAMNWLLENDKLFGILAVKIKKVKDQIDFDNSWYYSINSD